MRPNSASCSLLSTIGRDDNEHSDIFAFREGEETPSTLVVLTNEKNSPKGTCATTDDIYVQSRTTIISIVKCCPQLASARSFTRSLSLTLDKKDINATLLLSRKESITQSAVIVIGGGIYRTVVILYTVEHEAFGVGV